MKGEHLTRRQYQMLAGIATFVGPVAEGRLMRKMHHRAGWDNAGKMRVVLLALERKGMIRHVDQHDQPFLPRVYYVRPEGWAYLKENPNAPRR